MAETPTCLEGLGRCPLVLLATLVVEGFERKNEIWPNIALGFWISDSNYGDVTLSILYLYVST